MANIGIHNVDNIELDKYQLSSGTWVCKITIHSSIPQLKQESVEEICLFSQNENCFENLNIFS